MHLVSQTWTDPICEILYAIYQHIPTKIRTQCTGNSHDMVKNFAQLKFKCCTNLCHVLRSQGKGGKWWEMGGNRNDGCINLILLL